MSETTEPKKFIARYPSGKPFKQVTSAELEKRVLLVETWMRKGILLRSRLKRKIKHRWDIEWRQADEYIRRARERLLIHLNQSREEHRADSLAFYEGIMLNDDAAIAEKLRARERVDKLLGLEQPQQIQAEITARPSGISVESLDLESKKKLLRSIREKRLPEITIDVEEK